MRSTAAQAARVVKLQATVVQASRQGALRCPPVLDVDTWEAIAVPQQEALATATRGEPDQGQRP